LFPAQTVYKPSGKYGWCSRMQVKVHGHTDTRMLERSLATVENLSRQVEEYAKAKDDLERSVKVRGSSHSCIVAVVLATRLTRSTVLQVLSETTVNRDDVVDTGMVAFSNGVSWFGKKAVARADEMGEQVSVLTASLQAMCASLAASRDSNIMDVREKISYARARRCVVPVAGHSE
jgi:cell division protein FtsB